MPALSALIRGRMMRFGGTRRSLIATRLDSATFTPAAMAEIHRPTGTKLNRMMKKMIAAPAMIKTVVLIIKSSSGRRGVLGHARFGFGIEQPDDYTVAFHTAHLDGTADRDEVTL